MSTQDPNAPNIRFTFTHPQQNFRLLELPPALLELLSSPDPPTYVSSPHQIHLSLHASMSRSSYSENLEFQAVISSSLLMHCHVASISNPPFLPPIPRLNSPRQE
jgi:hypothetical protein